MSGWLLGWVIFSNEFALIFQQYTFFANINFTEIDVKVCHEKTPQDFSTGVGFVAICLIMSSVDKCIILPRINNKLLVQIF